MLDQRGEKREQAGITHPAREQAKQHAMIDAREVALDVALDHVAEAVAGADECPEAPDGLTHRVTHVHATDAGGRVHVLRGDVLRIAPVPHEVGGRRTMLNEGLARWTYEGREGFGIAEYLHQLDADGHPVVAVE